ncbi:MAG: hypothetical protein AABZ60_00140 [Planctomycetota bacterium]
MKNLIELKENAQSWAKGKSTTIRLPLVLWGFYVAGRIVTKQDSFTPFDWFNLGIHELGHVVFAVFGEFIGIAGGSFSQILVPILSVFMFLKQEDYFGASFCFCWLAESLFNLSFYIDDAVRQSLHLVSPFGSDPIHDWNYLLMQLNLLNWNTTFAFLTRVLAFVSVVFFMLSSAWLLIQMKSSQNKYTKTD